MKKIIFSISLAILSAQMLAVLATAQAAAVEPKTIPCVPGLPCIQEETQAKPAGSGGVRDYVLNIFGTSFITGFLGIAALTSVIFIIVGGTQMLLALGNEENLAKGKKTLIWAIGGLGISMLAVAIVQIVSNLFA